MNPKQIRTIIVDAVQQQLRAKNKREMLQPLHVIGSPGIGKSALPKSVAQEFNIGFIDNRPALRDPTDYRGIPAIVDGLAQWLPPSDLPTKHYCLTCERPLPDVKVDLAKGTCKICGNKTTDAGILFLDELDAAPPTTQAACYQLVLDRQIGEYRLPDRWLVIAAGNQMSDRAVTYKMSTALANRFTHIDFNVSLDDWTDWALTDGQIDANIIAFLKFRGGDLLMAFDPKSASHAFPTPRSWEFASRAIKYVRRQSLMEILKGTIGEGAAAEFVNFLKIQTELPDLAPILAGTSQWAPDLKRLDLKYALVSALATKADPKKHYENLLKYADVLPVEFNILMVQMMVSKNEQAVQLSPSFPKWCKEHSSVIITKKMI